jgi:metal-responsive CopG/Arc/MetJ family transcriptional regulator
MLKTIQITLPEGLLAKIDEAVHALNTNRSAFARQAFEQALAQEVIARQERQDAEGYARQPAQPGEFDAWESEQAWGDR